MPIPSSIADLSQTAGSNYPAGSESPSTIDDYLRTHAAYIAQLRDGKGSTAEAEIASAATVDIGAANSQFIKITGTTTITSLGTNYNGPRFIRFTGALTLTHNATTLILPTGANFAVQDGTTCIAIPNGNPANGWRIIGLDLTAFNVGVVPSSIGALRNVDKVKATKAFVTGYYASGDGGGGIYYYDAADTSSADNGITVIVAADGGRWKLAPTYAPRLQQFDTPAHALSYKSNQTTNLVLPIGLTTLASGSAYGQYSNIVGYGDESQIKVTTGTGLEYTTHTGAYDDHPHNFTEKFRVTGDGVFSAYPSAQTGTTTGQSFATNANAGSFGTAYGMSFELHNIGRYLKSTYVHNGRYNYYRANKIGLKLEEVTSYNEENSYFRYNSTAALQIVGGQNISISGGAIEGNPGVGIQYVAGSSTWGQINLRNVYLESNGNEATGVWSVDVPFGSPTMVNVIGGSYWRNVASGVTSGPYRFGDNVVMDGVTMGGTFYAKYARLRNCRGTPGLNTFGSEASSRLFGLTEPMVLLEYDPAYQEYDFSAATGGLVFCTPMQGRGSAKIPGVTNLANLTYPYGFGASSGATSSQNATPNYGEGDFFRVQYAASTGGFSTNYATLQSFPDTTKPYRVTCVIAYPEADCEIGVVQSVGGQSISAFFSLKANTYYRLVMCGMAPMTASSFLRVFPINANGPAINFLPVHASQHATHKAQLLVMKKLVEGAL